MTHGGIDWVADGQTTVYLGNLYEKNVTANTVTTYYYAGGQRVAQRQGTVVSYFVGDNLGSTSLTTDAAGAELGRQKYFPFGAPRVQSGALKTDFRFTGQRSEEVNFGSLYDYGARFYSPILGRFISPDTMIPAPGNPQSLNRYSYTINNPLKFVDPTGHFFVAIGAMAAGAVIGAGAGFVGSLVGQVAGNLMTGKSLEDSLNVNWKDVGVATAVGATAGFLAPITATTMIGAVVTSAVASGVQYLASQAVNERPVNAVDLGVSVGLGAAAGRIIGPLKSANLLPPDRTSPWLGRWASEAKGIMAEDLKQAAVAVPAVARSAIGGITSNAPGRQVIEKVKQLSRPQAKAPTYNKPRPSPQRQVRKVRWQ